MSVSMLVGVYDEATKLAGKAVVRLRLVSMLKGFLSICEKSGNLDMDDVREVVESCRDARVVVVEGHGFPDRVKVGRASIGLGNAHLLSAENVYAVACHTARSLGHHVVLEGYARGYVGFADEFVFAIKSIGDPLLDSYGRLFFMPVIHGFKTLLERGDAEEAARSMREMFREIGDYAFNNLGREGVYLAALLYYDAKVVRGLKAKEEGGA